MATPDEIDEAAKLVTDAQSQIHMTKVLLGGDKPTGETAKQLEKLQTELTAAMQELRRLTGK